MQNCNVTVIGGGPAGLLTSAHFAKRGARVTVYEKRTLQQQESPGFGWTIALGDVATAAIAEAGLSADFGTAGLCVPFPFALLPVHANFGAFYTARCARLCCFIPNLPMPAFSFLFAWYHLHEHPGHRDGCSS